VAAVRDRYERGGLIAAIAIMVGWSLLTSLPMVLTNWSTYSPPGTGVAVLAGYLVTGLAAAGAQLFGPGLSGRAVIVSSALLIVGAVVTALASPGGVLDPADWAFSNAGWFALVVVWRRPLTQLLAFCVGLWAAMTAVLAFGGQTDRLGWANLIMLSFVSAIMQFSIIAGARLLTRFATEAAEATRTQDRLETVRLAAEAVHEARRGRYEAVHRVSAELLTGLADDRLDLADPEVRRALRLAVGRLRRLVAETDEVPQPLLHELRACADEAERRGVEVDLQPLLGELPSLDAADRRALIDPVVQILAAADTHARVTVVCSGDSDVVVAVVADVSARVVVETVSTSVGVSSELEGDRQWVEARWTARSPSRS
jgi:hypothetical protein